MPVILTLFSEQPLRKPLILFTLFISLLVSGYLIYYKWFTERPVSFWELIPAETILVYEASSCATCLEELKKSELYQIIDKTSSVSKVDSLNVFNALIQSHLIEGSAVSLQATKKDDFDFIFYISGVEFPKQVGSLLEKKLLNNKKLVMSTRDYHGVDIHELSSATLTLSWINVKNITILSFTPVLIEDVVRTYTSDTRGFNDELQSIRQLPKIKNDAGNVYVSLKNLATWISLFVQETLPLPIQQLGKMALLDVKMSSDNNFVLNGFSVDSTGNSNAFLSTFSKQVPVPFLMKQYVSNRSVMFASYGISDGAIFNRDLTKFQQQHSFSSDSLTAIFSAHELNADNLWSSLSGEIGVSWLESKGNATSKIALITTTDEEVWLKAFNRLSDKLSIDTVFFEKYADYEIRELPIYKFSEKLFWPLITGFKSNYYTSRGNIIFLAEDLEELKLYLEDIEREETWGKSVSQNRFLESTLLESSISIFINTPRTWNLLEQSLHPKWRTFLKNNKPLLSSLEMGSIQFSNLNTSFYTNVAWSGRPNSTSEQKQVARSERIITNFDQSIVSFTIVRSHVTKGDEVLVQDSATNVSLVSADGKILWKTRVGGMIEGEVTQVDILKNGKLQYFFATPGILHLIDRLGKYVDPFPIKIKERDVEFVSVLDYDRSKNYRFLVAGKSGKLWMFDKTGKNLEGWTPNGIENGLVCAPQHHRIRGKDYILAVREDGMVHLMNRRGEPMPNFPLNLNARPSGQYFLEIGKGAADTFFVIVTRDGFRIKFNLEGKIQSREILLKNAIDAQFTLVREKDFKNYCVVRREAKYLTVFDENLKEILVSDFIGNNPVDVSYVDFGSGKVVYVITDLSQDLSFIYDGQGKLQTTMPLESNRTAIRSIDFDKIKIYSTLGNSLTVQPN